MDTTHCGHPVRSLLIGVLALYPDRQQPVVTAQMVEIKPMQA